MSEIGGADQAYSDVFESYEGTVKSSSPVKVRKVNIYELCLSYSLHTRQINLPGREVCLLCRGRLHCLWRAQCK